MFDISATIDKALIGDLLKVETQIPLGCCIGPHTHGQ